MGGRVGLKGTDGVVEEALRRGAKPIAADRTREFLNALLPWLNRTDAYELITSPGPMGEDIVRSLEMQFTTVDVNVN